MSERKFLLLWLIFWGGLIFAAWPLNVLNFAIVMMAAFGLYFLPTDKH